MKKTILALALMAGLTSFAGNAKADFNYSFSNDWFVGSGFGATTTGTIFGSFNLDNTFNFTSISATSGIYSNTLTVGDNPIQVYGNTLSNEGGVISGLVWLNENNTTTALPNIGVSFDLENIGISTFGVDNDNFSGSTSLATVVQSVPEPSTYALFGIGALALVVAYRRKVV